MAAAQKKEKLTLYRLRDKLELHGLSTILPSEVTNYALQGKTVVCVFSDKKHMDDWLARYWHTINMDRAVKERINTFTKTGISFDGGGKIIPRELSPDYKFLGYNVKDTVMSYFTHG